MWRLNVQSEQFDSCVYHMAHATKERFNFEIGDILLFQTTTSPRINSHERIRCYMHFREMLEDPATVVQYWGERFREHRFLIRGDRLTFIRPFSLADVQVSSKIYDNQKTANRIDPDDIEIVERLIKIKPL